MHTDDLSVTQPLPDELDSNAPESNVDAKAKKRWAELRQQIEITKTYRKQLVRNWSVNIDYRRGKLFASQSDDDTIPVNLDWGLTKTKQAALFSQVPHVYVAHHPESVSVGPWVAAFERDLNDKLLTGGIEAAMDEVMPDCINAAGFAAVIVAFESLTEDKDVPAIDLSGFPPEIQMEAMQNKTIFGQPIPMETVPVPVDTRYTIRRISPADFLWPVDFTGSDFDNAPWIGHTGRISWAEAVTRFKLNEEDKTQFLSEETTVEDRLSHDFDRERAAYDNKVGFDEIFYHEHMFDSESKSFSTIRHVVFLHGKTEPVIDEPWRGQHYDPETNLVTGALRKPIRVLTLTYISDETIPPSDSAVGRAQVNEISKGRTQVNRQRERSIPYNWFDVNRLDPSIQQAMMRGTWLNSVPVQGDGSRVIGQVQQARIAPENFTFDRTAKQDLYEQWTIGTNQIGTGDDVETKGEAGIIQSNFVTKVARERAKVGSFVVGIAQVVGGLMCLYEDSQKYGEGFDPAFSKTLAFSILADSTVLVDANQRLKKLNDFVSNYGKSGWVNLEPVFKEIATLVGLDPNIVITPPKPEPPAAPNISLRLSGSEDMMNPLLLALLIKSGQAPDPELVEKAKQLIQQAVVEPVMPQAPQPGPAPGGPVPPPPPPAVGDANPQMTTMPTINKRSDAPENPDAVQ